MSTAFGSHNETYRFGSAGWASDDEIARAGMFKQSGIQIGFRNNQPVYIGGDAPLICVGGAGSGKLRDLLSYTVCDSPYLRKMILDPRGELAAISIHTFAIHGKEAFCFNPLKMHGLTSHGCNPLSILKKDSPSLFADSSFIAESLIPLSGGNSESYFTLRARGYMQALLFTIVQKEGGVNFPHLMSVLNAIEGNPILWASWLELMLESDFEFLRSAAGEFLKKSQEAPKEFGAIIGEIMAHMAVFNDPLLMETLSGNDFSLDDFDNLFLIIPAEYIGIWSALLKAMFTVAMIYKSRNPQGDRLHLIVDEAGQLGRAEFLIRAHTFGRGAGVRILSVFQDIGQIQRNLGKEALQTLMGSSQTRLFFGVRDLETAEYVSKMLGHETLEFDNVLEQQKARSQKKQIVQGILEGADPFKTVHEFHHLSMAESNRTKQTRWLMTPSEVLGMPEDRLVAFVSGLNLKPLYLEKYPYYERPEMAGLYLPNPHHPPIDKVRIRTRWSDKWVMVITEPVPKKYAQYPQYSSGSWSYLKGYKPL